MRFVKPADAELIRELEPLNLERIRELDAQGWYDFLFDKYFHTNSSGSHLPGSDSADMDVFLARMEQPRNTQTRTA